MDTKEINQSENFFYYLHIRRSSALFTFLKSQTLGRPRAAAEAKSRLNSTLTKTFAVNGQLHFCRGCPLKEDWTPVVVDYISPGLSVVVVTQHCTECHARVIKL